MIINHLFGLIIPYIHLIRVRWLS